MLMVRVLIAIITTLILLTQTVYLSDQSDNVARIVAGSFSAGQNPGDPPSGWQLKDIKGKTSYSVINDGGVTVLRAESKGSASGLFKDVVIDPKRYPLVEWGWKVERLPATANEREKNKDDCAARVYVIFKDPLPGASAFSKLKHKLATTFSSIVPPGVTICYVWSNRLTRDQSIESPYTEWVRIVAVESGPGKVGEWVSEQRNVVEDFKRLFGKEPEQIVGVAVMTDMDQTGESVTAFYREIAFKAGR
jgi:hypothetical protein